MKVLGVDPGFATGLARWWPTPYLREPDGTVLNAVPPFLSMNVSRDNIDDMLAGNIQHYDAIAYEPYVITARTLRLTRQYDALEIIGVIKHYGRKYNIPLYPQPVGDAAEFATDTKLKRLGWYKTGPDHANSAARQVLLWLSIHDFETFDKLWRDSAR